MIYDVLSSYTAVYFDGSAETMAVLAPELSLQ